jgi:hypothetical protein
MSGLALADTSSIACQAARGHVLDFDMDDITPAQLDVDCKIEHCQVAFLAVQLKLGAECRSISVAWLPPLVGRFSSMLPVRYRAELAVFDRFLKKAWAHFDP